MSKWQGARALSRTAVVAIGVTLGASSTPAQEPAAQPPPAAPQPPAPVTAPGTASATVTDRITFREAIERAVARNPTIEQAAADILRADALVRQARANTLPEITGNVTTTTVHPVVEFDGQSATPRNQLVAGLNVSALLYAPVAWALRAQAGDNKAVAELGADDVRRQIALATAQAYLSIIAQRRVVEASQRAVDTARAHFDLARVQQERGSGSKLNQLRAQQELSTDEAALEDARFAVYQAQEALGVLLAAEAPLDAADEPVLQLPGTPDVPQERLGERPDIRLAVAREAAAQRVVDDSWKDRLPTVSASLLPTFTTPDTLFTPNGSWRLQFLVDVPIFDAGFRAARKAERESILSRTRLEGVALRRQATSEIRTASEAVKSAERALLANRAAADQARQVVDIVNVAFRAGATTNIEVIDAQRTARDADTAAAAAEDTLRRARLDLLVASGRFP